MLMTHYREPIDFSVRRLEEAENIFEKWRRLIPSATNWNNKSDTQHAWEGQVFDDDEALDHLKNDLDFSAFFRRVNALVDQADGGRSALKAFAALRAMGLVSFDDIVNLSIEEAVKGLALDEGDVSFAINRRLAFIREKNFAEADRIRDELLSQGIQLMDYKDPETDERKTKWEVKR